MRFFLAACFKLQFIWNVESISRFSSSHTISSRLTFQTMLYGNFRNACTRRCTVSGSSGLRFDRIQCIAISSNFSLDMFQIDWVAPCNLNRVQLWKVRLRITYSAPSKKNSTTFKSQVILDIWISWKCTVKSLLLMIFISCWLVIQVHVMSLPLLQEKFDL